MMMAMHAWDLMQYYNNVFGDYDARELSAPNPPGVGG